MSAKLEQHTWQSVVGRNDETEQTARLLSSVVRAHKKWQEIVAA